MHKVIVTGGAVLLLKVLYDAFIGQSVPNKEIIGFMPTVVKGSDGKDYTVNRISFTADDFAFAGLAGVALGTVEGFTRKVAP